MYWTARAYRATQNIPETADLSIDKGLTVLFGLNSLWALLMYRSNKRVANGALPVHVANIHRTFVGYEGVLEGMVEDMEPDAQPESTSELIGMAVSSTRSGLSGERCPARPRTIGEGMVALLMSPHQARAKLWVTLEQCQNPRLLVDLHVDDATFTNFAFAMQAFSQTEAAEDLAKVQRLLDKPVAIQ